LSEFLNYNKDITIDDDAVLNKRKAKETNDIFNLLDSLYTLDDIKQYHKYITQDNLEYLLNWLEKKEKRKQSAEYTDLVTLVIFPMILKNVVALGDKNKIDKCYLLTN
jgi:uncharacterized UBP type Zn finger protein